LVEVGRVCRKLELLVKLLVRFYGLFFRDLLFAAECAGHIVTKYRIDPSNSVTVDRAHDHLTSVLVCCP
jgi:hypothetical protein